MAGYIGTKAAVVTPGAERKKVFSITTTTTSLTGLAYTPGFVHVFHNGVRLVDGTDYTATNGTSLTLTTAAQNGDEVVVISYATFQTSDTVSASAGGTFSNAVTVNGNLTVDTNTLFVDAANNRVGVGTTSVSGILSVDGSMYAGPGSVSGVAYGFYPSSTYGNTGMFSPSANTVAFATSGGERARIDASGNVGIGVTDMSVSGANAKLAVAGGVLNLDDNQAVAWGGGTGRPGIKGAKGTGSLILYDNVNIASNGYVGFDVTSPTYRVHLNGGTPSNSNSGIAAAWNVHSDYRLKENVVEFSGAFSLVSQLRPVKFSWVGEDQSEATTAGFIAHEMAEVAPYSVIGEKDAVNEDGSIKSQAADYSKLVPLLTAALQEALSEIQDLKARVATLEGGAA